MATNSTVHYHFPLFAGNDKPSILTDWNGTVEDLDEILADFEGRIESNTQITQGFNDQVLALRRAFEELEMKLEGDETSISENTTNIFLLREQLLTFGAKVKEHTISIDALETEVDSIQSAISDLDNIRAMAEAGSQASTIAYNNRNCLSSGLANQLFIPALPVAFGDYVYGHRVNEDTHQDQPVEGALYKCIQNHTGDWNSAHFERAEGVLKTLETASAEAEEDAQNALSDIHTMENRLPNVPGYGVPDYGKIVQITSQNSEVQPGSYSHYQNSENAIDYYEGIHATTKGKFAFVGSVPNPNEKIGFFCFGRGTYHIDGDHASEFQSYYPARVQIIKPDDSEYCNISDCYISVKASYDPTPQVNRTTVSFAVVVPYAPEIGYINLAELQDKLVKGVPFILFNKEDNCHIKVTAANFFMAIRSAGGTSTDPHYKEFSVTPFFMLDSSSSELANPSLDEIGYVACFDVSQAYPNS